MCRKIDVRLFCDCSCVRELSSRTQIYLKLRKFLRLLIVDVGKVAALQIGIMAAIFGTHV